MADTSRRSFSSHRPAQYIVLPFLILSFLYIYFSDLVLEVFIEDIDMVRRVQTAKGWVYITLTAGGLYLMIRWQMRRLLDAERRTTEQEEQFRHVFDYAVSGMTILDPRGNILRVNDVLLQMLGYRREQMVGMNVLDYTHPEDQQVRLNYLQRQLAGERPEAPLEVRYRRADGGYVWVLVSSVLMHGVDGCALCFISQVVDVSKRRHAEEELLEQRAALAHASRLITLGELAAGLTHELTQPLTAIGQYADVAVRRVHREGEAVSDPLREAVEGIHEEAERARDIVERWRTFSRGQGPRPVPVEPNVVVRDSIRLLSHEARREGVNLRLDLQDGLPRIAADHVQLEQVLVNLIGNAIDALGSCTGPRQVTVRTSQISARLIAISVSDNGPGIDEHATPHLFEPFFTTKPHGIGLGLPISRSIIQSHGGQIVMTREQGWTTFRCELPILQERNHVAA